MSNLSTDFFPVSRMCVLINYVFLVGPNFCTQHPGSGNVQVRQELIIIFNKSVVSFLAVVMMIRMSLIDVKKMSKGKKKTAASPYRCTCRPPQRGVRLRHIGAPTRTLSHNPLYPQLSPHLCLPPVVVFNSSLSFLRRFSVSLVSSPQGRPAALQIQSDLRHGMTLASQPWLSSCPGLAAAGQGQSLMLVDHGALDRGRVQLWIGVPNTCPYRCKQDVNWCDRLKKLKSIFRVILTSSLNEQACTRSIPYWLTE